MATPTSARPPGEAAGAYETRGSGRRRPGWNESRAGVGQTRAPGGTPDSLTVVIASGSHQQDTPPRKFMIAEIPQHRVETVGCRFQRPADDPEIERRGKHDHIRRHKYLVDFGHIVILDTGIVDALFCKFRPNGVTIPK